MFVRELKSTSRSLQTTRILSLGPTLLGSDHRMSSTIVSLKGRAHNPLSIYSKLVPIRERRSDNRWN